jgi:hypothetical protein
MAGITEYPFGAGIPFISPSRAGHMRFSQGISAGSILLPRLGPWTYVADRDETQPFSMRSIFDLLTLGSSAILHPEISVSRFISETAGHEVSPRSITANP